MGGAGARALRVGGVRGVHARVGLEQVLDLQFERVVYIALRHAVHEAVTQRLVVLEPGDGCTLLARHAALEGGRLPRCSTGCLSYSQH